MIEFFESYCELNNWIFELVKEKTCDYLLSENYSCNDDGKSFFKKQKEFIKKTKKKVQLLFMKHFKNLDWVFKNIFDYDVNQYPAIRVYFTIYTIFPRDIERRRFLIPLCDNDNFVLSIIFHELTHFMFFDKLEIESNSIDDNFKKASELLIPVLFDFLDKKFDYNLYVSNYCVTEEQINVAKIEWDVFLKNKNFDEFVKKLIKIVR